MADDYIARLGRTLANCGITSYRIEHRRRHRRVVVAHGSMTITVTFPSSGSDWRGARNAGADLRRRLKEIA
jgi:hypothetical protein